MKKILVIEDESFLREDILEILRLDDFDALGAENGILGVQAAREYHPDLIICDMMMPERNGDWVLLELRSDPITATVPFIFLTAKTTRSDMRRGMELGANDYLMKPFRPSELLAAVNTQLEKQALILREYERRLEELRESVIRALPHELRTPLTGILGYSRMLMEDAELIDPPQVQQMAQGIERAARRMRRLTENYLLYAQLEVMLADQHKMAGLRQNLVEDACKLLKNVISQKAAEARREKDIAFDCPPVAVQISEEDLSKIAYELLDNAIKFSTPNTAIDIQGVVESGYFVLTLIDHGRGMTPEEIAHIGAYVQFERRFYEHPGLGLGLMIARRLAEVYGGSLVISSTPNTETRVIVKLPLHNSP